MRGSKLEQFTLYYEELPHSHPVKGRKGKKEVDRKPNRWKLKT